MITIYLNYLRNRYSFNNITNMLKNIKRIEKTKCCICGSKSHHYITCKYKNYCIV